MKQFYSGVKRLVCLAIPVALGLQSFYAQADSWTGSVVTLLARQGAVAFANPAALPAGKAHLVTGATSNVAGTGTTTNRQFTPPNQNNIKTVLGGVARRDAVGFTIGPYGYVATGLDNSGNNLSDVWQYNFGDDSWTQKASLPASARRNAVGFNIGAKGYIGTGWDGTTNFNDFWEYDTTANAWSAKTPFPGTARHGAVGFSINVQGYIGTGQDASALNNDFYQYDQGTNTWSSKAAFPGSARSNAVGFSIAIKGYIGTGNDGARKVDFYEYDSPSNTWAAKANFTGSARDMAIGFCLGGTGYLGTGSSTGANALSDLYAYAGDAFIYEYPLSGSVYSAGGQINVRYATNMLAGSVLTAQLSNASGSFASPVSLGTITITNINQIGTINGTIPSAQPVGTGYRVRVINGATISNDNGANFSIVSPAHVTLSLQNVAQTASNNVQFDLMVTSDGDPASDLRANSFQYGVDYNTAILPAGTITPSFVFGTSDFASIASYSFPAPGVGGTVRVVGNACTGCNTIANKLIVGHAYRIGRFQLTGSSNFVACTGTGLALVDAVVAGKTTSAAILYIGADATSSTSFDQTGVGNIQRSVGAVSNISVNCVTNVNLKLFIEGYYTSGSQMKPVMQNEGVAGATSSQTDTVIIELHSTVNPATIVESHKAVLASNGTVSYPFSPSITGQTLWLAVRHREAIFTWSSAPVLFSGTTNYDFSTAANKAYGSNQVQLEAGIFGFYCGDITQDENVDLIDFPLLDYAIGMGLFGYNAADLNGDGNTDLMDFVNFDPNLINGRYSQHP